MRLLLLFWLLLLCLFLRLLLWLFLWLLLWLLFRLLLWLLFWLFLCLLFALCCLLKILHKFRYFVFILRFDRTCFLAEGFGNLLQIGKVIWSQLIDNAW